MTPYERVQQSRALTAATFPLPSVLDCIRYAITELAEYDDALLRQERTGDKRNNDKAHDPRTELGQALYMLLSAAVQLKVNLHSIYGDHNGAGDGLRLEYAAAMLGLANAMRPAARLSRIGADDKRAEHEQNRTMRDAYNAMYRTCNAWGWPVDALIDDTCAAFERKHAPVEVR